MSRLTEKLVSECNELADRYAVMSGHISRPDYKYYEATHPQEVMFWEFAVEAYSYIEGTDIEDCLTEVLDENSQT